MPTLEQIKALKHQCKELNSKSLDFPVSNEILEDWKAYDETYTHPLSDELENTEEDKNKDWAISRFGGELFERVGNGVQTNEYCGSYLHTYVCLHVELHDKVTLNGVSYKGKVPLKKVFNSCDKPSCPICFKRGWANREAQKASIKIEKISCGYVDDDGKKHSALGKSEHIIDSVSRSDYSLSFKKLKAKHQKLLMSLGVLGGISIFHLQRYHSQKEALVKNVPFGWYISPHWHTVGWIDGGYGKCRSCPNVWLDLFDGGVHVKDTEKCLLCSGFEGRVRHSFLKEGGVFGSGNGKGWIIKVKGERKSVRVTLFYQLNHASFIRGRGRARVDSWWGVAAATKIKLSKEDRKFSHLCPICQSEMVKGVRVGGKEEMWWVKEWEESFLGENGLPNWVAEPEKKDFCKKGRSGAERSGASF